MKTEPESYGFGIDLENFTQDGDNRFFEVLAEKEFVEKFIADMQLFQGEEE